MGTADGSGQPARPSQARFAAVSGASSLTPSMAISRRCPSHAPGAPGAASGAATFSNSSLTGASPSRSRACEIAPVVGTTQSCDQARMNCSPPVSRRITSS